MEQQTILIVEQEYSKRNIIEAELTKAGYIIESASNSKDAHDILSINQSIDVVVLNIYQNLALELEFAELIIKTRPEIRLILTAAYPVWVKFSKKIGVFDFIKKPYSIFELINILSKSQRMGVALW